MRIYRILLVILCLMVASSAMATKPSGSIVAVGGKNYYLHTVKRGETLYSLSKLYGVSQLDIIAANENLSAETLKADSKLLIPYVELQEAKSEEQPKSNDKFVVHTIESGDTLYSIARKYKISMATLEKDNPSIVAGQLPLGGELMVRRAEMGYASKRDLDKERKRRDKEAQAQVADNEHYVRPGETLYYLSRRYNISEEELLALNNLQHYSDIMSGMILVIAAPVSEDSTTNVDEAEEGSVSDEQGGEMTEIENVSATRDSSVVATPLDMYSTLRVSLVLPFHVRGKVNTNYVDFYKGVLLAMEELKKDGISVELSVFDTQGTPSRVQEIADTEQSLAESQLIIGPVHESELSVLLPYAEQNSSVVVSPLADVESVRSPLLFQMQAEPEYKCEKAKRLFDGSREVIVIYTGNNDADYLAEVNSMLVSQPSHELNFVFNRESFFYERNADGTNGVKVDVEMLMRTPSNKTYAIVAANETDVDRILTTLSSIRASIGGRSLSYGEYVVYGDRKWLNMRNIDSQTFFKNNVVFVVPYHAKRSEYKLLLFDSHYADTYGTLPTMFSYRGYDAAMIFCRKMFSGIDSSIENEAFTPLITTYRFKMNDGVYVNTEWTYEAYKSNFTINKE